MKVEITKFNDSGAVVKLLEPMDKEIFNNTYNGRVFGYLDLWKKGSSTDEQRKHYWALVKDYVSYTGDPKWRVNLNFKALWHMTTESAREPSVARGRMSQKEVAEWLQIIIEFMIDNGVPFHHPTGYVPSDLSKMLFKLTMNRMCVVCGKPHADIAHFDGTVGMGRDRQSIDHTSSKFLALCREHHNEQHNIGEKSFLDKYQLVPLKLDKADLKNLGVI